MAIRLLIADDDSLIRESLKIILSMDEAFEVAACVENGQKAVEYCLNDNIDIALLDVRMPVMNGVQAVKEISLKTKTKTIILTTFDDDEFIFEAVKNGAKGYLLKNNSPDRIKEAINMVYAGNSVIQDIVLEKLKEGLNVKKRKFDESLFSERELQIMKLISKGFSNKEISKSLYISEGTVKNYITSILDKTGLSHRTQIAIYYMG
ncbi:response regulator [Candidatus Clostridium radicumherbarum]|uniref:Stage 0 sporulation protein A homolog n=1 Tax=Candidatus Clostridium radicumherbarum TaxID=3381662 RepID=A0ABW8TNL2_9CLOT